MLDEYSKASREILDLARAEALASESQLVDTEHLLLALVLRSGTFAKDILSKSDVHPSKVRKAIQKVSSSRPVFIEGVEGLPFSPYCTRALAAAKAFRTEWKESLVAPEHILLGLLWNKLGVAWQVLSQLGVDLDSAGRQVAHHKGKKDLPPLEDRF